MVRDAAQPERIPPDTTIILIGPMGVGKTSVAKKLSAVTGLKCIDVDEARWDFFAAQSDFDGEFVNRLFNASRGTEAFQYMKPFEARLVLHIFDQYACGVFDFGAGYTVYTDNALFETVKTAFSKHKNIIYLRYSDDKYESLHGLRGRHAEVPEDLYFSLNAGFIESPCYEALATITIDTKNKSIQDVVDVILNTLRT